MTPLPPVTILEEFLLLALDEQAGAFWPVPRSAFDGATAAAALMDLMRLRRIDCDVRSLFVVDAAPAGDDILDPLLRALAVDPVRGTRSIHDELRFFAEEGATLRDRAMRRLAERGVLKGEEEKILWVFGARLYPVRDNGMMRGVRQRLAEAVRSDRIADPRDAVLVALAHGCGLLHRFLSDHDMARGVGRIAQIAGSDVLGRAAVLAIHQTETSIAMASGLG